MHKMLYAAVITLSMCLLAPAHALDNHLARTPPMGWNSWNSFHCDVSAKLVEATADAMVSSGMKAAGYQYVNIDDCWLLKKRSADGKLVPDPRKFPHGIKAVADYVHRKGLKLGIYESAGTTTCAGYPGSIGHEASDAKQFASWGVDYLKYDNCGDYQGETYRQRYTAMRDALAASGRAIVYSLCEWGNKAPWTWAQSIGNLWRTTQDITPRWETDQPANSYPQGIMDILDQQAGLSKTSHPGAWNDPDMLEVGNGYLTDNENRAHFSLWALLNAPLIAGNDIRHMSDKVRAVLTNKDVIAVDQDWGGRQGYKVRDDGSTEVWAKPMSDGSVAVILLNRGKGPINIATTAHEIGLKGSAHYTVRNLWTHHTATSTGPIKASVPTHAVAMFRVWPGQHASR
ncbi:glycoside hydrolase family 27 protein [Oleiagrimonas sp. C23AA]|uniref:glycoside hydrolase family 27 protein n=1 Tax=Oleiagrimonas sp. C23AA TaxID=2719047 RepID=UPI001422C660|nr:glycoside hydrolase family 27 protein [Oleiagrimonas sp. C23AA]NII09550.1 glycoside hydrolase family 27 protein [Oleiagrimonas sp. C23AA]